MATSEGQWVPQGCPEITVLAALCPWVLWQLESCSHSPGKDRAQTLSCSRATLSLFPATASVGAFGLLMAALPWAALGKNSQFFHVSPPQSGGSILAGCL